MVKNGKFFGTFNHKLDKSNRLMISSKLLSHDNYTFLYLSKGFDKNVLVLRTEETFNVFCNKLLSLSESRQKNRALRRLLMANTYKLELDLQNRIVIPKPLLDKVNLSKEVTLIGNIDQIEIWDAKQYVAEEINANLEFAETLESLLND